MRYFVGTKVYIFNVVKNYVALNSTKYYIEF